MDLASESSVFGSSVDEDNDVTSLAHFDVEVQNSSDSNANQNSLGNGAFEEVGNSSSAEPVKMPFLLDMNEAHNVGLEQVVNSPPATTSPVKKGRGLRKWRRIRRDHVSDSCPSVDYEKTLKRGLSGSENLAKPVHFFNEGRAKSEGSEVSSNMVTKNHGGVEYPIQGSSSDSRQAVGSVFAAGTDSENSEDRSSKSSTAASAPKMRYDMPAMLGHSREKNKMKNPTGKIFLGNSPHRTQQGKTRIESTKKPRGGEKVKVEKENSHSSLESDSRSSNFVFLQGSFSTSNGKQSGKATNYDGENSDDDAQASEQQFSEDLQTRYTKDNVEEVEDLSEDDLAVGLSSGKVKKGRSENHRSPTEKDPLVKSILTLQSAQEALEQELQKFMEIGKEHSCASAESEIDPNSFNQLGADKNVQHTSSSLETEIISLTQKVNSLEHNLDEARATLTTKECRVLELEATLSNKFQQENFGEMETELEGIFLKKIEAEVEYLTIAKTIKNLKTFADDHKSLYEEQKSLAREQVQTLNKLEVTKSKVESLKKEADVLQTKCEEISETEEVAFVQSKVSKLTKCLCVQLILLGVFLWLFALQLSPRSEEVVPT